MKKKVYNKRGLSYESPLLLEQVTGFEPVLRRWQRHVLTIEHHTCITW